MSWGFSFDINTLVKKVRNDVEAKLKASKFFTMKTSFEVNEELYFQSKEAEFEKKCNLDFIVEKALKYDHERINRMNKCKSLFSQRFVSLMMKHRERECTMVTDKLFETGMRAGFLSKTGYAVGIEIHAQSHHDLSTPALYIMTFGSTHEIHGDMQQAVGPMEYEQALSTNYPDWFNKILAGA